MTALTRLHWLDELGKLVDAEAFIAELTRQSFAVVAVPVPMAAPVRGIFAAPETVLGHSGAAGPLVWSFKRQGELKERSQIRRVSLTDAENLLDAEDLLLSSFQVLESIAAEVMGAWCTSQKLPLDLAKERFGDLSFAPPGSSSEELGKGKSVLNLYHYFNSCEEEPCRSHADPGLVTVLGRSTLPGLQAVLPVKPGGAPGRPAVYEDHWCDLEPLMDELGQGKEPHVPFLVLVGESLERLSGGWHPSCVHRVKHSEVPGRSRFNMAFELRPRCNLWHPWQSLLATPETEAKS